MTVRNKETASPSVPAAAEVDGEQRRVVLMFADVSGSTELIEQLDPEQAARLLDPLIGVMAETVERYGGTVSPRGDGVLATFGIGGTAEDSAARACFAAFEIMHGLRDASAQVRIGIHQGEVALLSGPRRQSRENLFGPAIHIAARLEQSTQPGTASISTDAYGLVREFVDAEPLPPVEVRGLSRPLQRMRLLRVRSTSRWRARLAQGLAPLVDRQAELAAITRFLKEATRPGVHYLQVLGPPGTGKSRLVHEVLRSDAGRACYLVTLTGPLHRGYAGYDPIAQWLRELAGANDADAAADLVKSLPGIDALAEAERERLERYLDVGTATNARLADIESLMPLRVIKPIATIIAKAARDRSVLISCEDTETLGDDRLAQITALADAVTNCGLPVILIVSSRRAIKPAGSNIATRKTLRLQSLGQDDARRLLARLRPELRRHPKLVEAVLEKAAGNPLFLEEVAARMGTGAEQSEAIPDRIDALIGDRLARLPRQVQTLLLICSVLGSVFSPGALSALAQQCEQSVQQQLAKLKAEHLLYEVPGSSARLSFGHSLIRDVAYNTLLPSRRRSLHERALRLLEQQPQTANLEDLCHHAVQARLWEEALRYLQQAAVAAAERAAYASAEQHLRRALKIAEQQPQDRPMQRTMVEIMMGLRAVVALDLRQVEADELLDRAEKLGADLEPAIRLAIQLRRVRALNTAGRLREAIGVARTTRQQGRESGHIPVQCTAAYMLGQSYFYVGRFAAGDTTLTEAANLALTGPHSMQFAVGDSPAMIQATRAGVRGFLGRFADAEADAAQAITIAQSQQAIYDLAFAHFASGLVQLRQRHLIEAETAFRAGLDITERHSLRALLPSLNVGLGHTLLLSGSTNAAIAALVDAHEAATQGNRVLNQMWAAVGLAAAHGSTGGTLSALRYADEAVALGARHTLRGLLVSALRCRGALLATEEEKHAAGVRNVRQALALARKLGMRPDVAHCLTALAAILDDNDARNQARAIYQALGMQPWAEHVLEQPSVPLSIIAA